MTLYNHAYTRLPKSGDVKVSAAYLNTLLKRIERLEKLHGVSPINVSTGAQGIMISLNQFVPVIGMFELTGQIGSEASDSGYVGFRSGQAQLLNINRDTGEKVYGDTVPVYDPIDIFSGNEGDCGYYALLPDGKRHILQLHC